MSLASQYAASVDAVPAPPSWTGPADVLTATVDENGNCLLIVPGKTYTVPPPVILSFASWATSTFT
jgi:hypothetical protein